MAGRIRILGEHLKTFWETQPVIFISVAMGVAGKYTGVCRVRFIMARELA